MKNRNEHVTLSPVIRLQIPLYFSLNSYTLKLAFSSYSCCGFLVSGSDSINSGAYSVTCSSVICLGVYTL